MCIYCGTNKYRKIYENHHGPIGKDPSGRTMEVHHIDGNHNNNDISNLKLVTIQDHYDIHRSQGDWAACLRIASKMKLAPEELSKIASENNRVRVSDGTHNFIGGEIQRLTNHKRVVDGTHNWLGPESNQCRIDAGTHNFLGPEMNRKRVEDGTHHFLSGEIQRKVTKRRLSEGTHHFLGGNMNQKMLAEGKHTSQMKVTCEQCGKTVTRNTIGQHMRASHSE